MRKLALGISATALLTAAAAAPAVAQVGFYAGLFGVGVGVGAPAYYDCGYYGNPCGYYDYYGGPNIVVGGGWAFRHGGPDTGTPECELNRKPPHAFRDA